MNEHSKNNNNNYKSDNIQSKEETGNNKNVNMIVEDDDNNNLNNFYDKDEKQDKDLYENEEENSNNNKYYNAFNNINKNGNKIQIQQNIKLDKEEKNYANKRGKIPNITLTTFQPSIINNDEKERNYFPFLNLFSSKKKENEVQKDRELKAEKGKKNNELIILEDKLKGKSVVVDKLNKQKEEDKNIKKNKNDLVLNVKSSKGNEMEKNDEEKEEEEINKELNNNINKYNFIIKAEPIMNNNNKEDMANILKNEDNICSSEEMEDIDKSSIYSYFSGKSIMELIRKKSNCSPLLIAILFGSCGLFYLLYKKINLKELLSKISGCSKFIFSIFSAGLEDFMAKYNDIHRLLVGIIIFVCLWFLFKMYIKKFLKNIKK